jgi:dimeric dUTPase (all-alpha-NTP-PPase superfamily)
VIRGERKVSDQAAIQRMLRIMVELQEAHNRQIAEDWRERGFEFYRAVWVECAELLEHFGWKWWKGHEPDLEQVKLEIIDIWHFGLSEIMREGMDAELALRIEHRLAEPRAMDFRASVEALAEKTLAARAFPLERFLDLMQSLPMRFDELFSIYVGKNVLNRFRQDHGYLDGEYVKSWAGREDNEHLVEVVASLDVESDDFAERLYGALEERYMTSAL